MVAQVTDLAPGELILTLGDAHLYNNHLECARSQLARAPRALPRLQLNPARRSLDEFAYDDVGILDYDPLPAIRAPISV
jgi:thymidylate synthase